MIALCLVLLKQNSKFNFISLMTIIEMLIFKKKKQPPPKKNLNIFSLSILVSFNIFIFPNKQKPNYFYHQRKKENRSINFRLQSGLEITDIKSLADDQSCSHKSLDYHISYQLMF
jgi:hypothetical protein